MTANEKLDLRYFNAKSWQATFTEARSQFVMTLCEILEEQGILAICLCSNMQTITFRCNCATLNVSFKSWGDRYTVHNANGTGGCTNDINEVIKLIKGAKNV